MSTNQDFTTFTFQDEEGFVDAFGFVRWAGMGFTVDAAGAELRGAIEQAKASA